MKILWFGLVIALSAKAELNDNEFRCASALDKTIPGLPSYDRAGKGFIASNQNNDREVVLWGNGYTYFCKPNKKLFVTHEDDDLLNPGTKVKGERMQFQVPSSIRTDEDDKYNTVVLNYSKDKKRLFKKTIKGHYPFSAFNGNMKQDELSTVNDDGICSQKHTNETQNVIWNNLKVQVEMIYIQHKNLLEGEYGKEYNCSQIKGSSIAALRACQNIPLVKDVVANAISDFDGLCPKKNATDPDNSSGQGGAPK